MSNLKDINFTKHAEDMLIERRFQKELIADIVAHPERVEQGEGDIWFAFKRIEGYEGCSERK